MIRYSVNRHLGPKEDRFTEMDMVSFLLELKANDTRREFLTSGRVKFHVESDSFIEVDDPSVISNDVAKLMLSWGFEKDVD